jgi:hypothetical protein
MSVSTVPCIFSMFRSRYDICLLHINYGISIPRLCRKNNKSNVKA